MAEKKTFKWSKLILAGSLGLNLIIVGLVAGAWMNGPKRAERGGTQISWDGGPFGRALSKEDRRMLGDTMRNSPEMRQELRQRRGEMRRIGLEIASVLRADPFDRAALETLFAQQAQMGADVLQLGRQSVLDRITAMSPEDRASFADRLEEGMQRGRKRNKDRD